MLKSIGGRLLATYLLLIAVVLSVITLTLVVFLIQNPRLAREAENNLLLAASAIERQRLGDLSTGAQASLAEAVQAADSLLNVRVALLDPQGNLLADSRAEEGSLPTTHSMMGRGPDRDIAEFNDDQGDVWLFTSRPLPGGYSLLVASPRPRAPFLSFFTDELFPPIVRAGVVALALSFVLALLMTRSITAPLQRVVGATRDLAQGKMRTIAPEGPSELQSLATSFNEMGTKVTVTQQAQRDFIANISHELRTPLTSIQGFAQAIADGTVREGPEIRKSAQVVQAEAGRMQRLVNDLLDLARLDATPLSLNLQPVDVESLLKETTEKFAPLAQKANVRLSADVPSKVKVNADYERLVQVLDNLVDNALKATPAGGSITATARVSGDDVLISIADTGPGIPAKETKRIFERFYQVDKSRKAGQRGSGLGLSIAQQIVQAHGGEIRVESKPGQGSTFVIRLPKAA